MRIICLGVLVLLSAGCSSLPERTFSYCDAGTVPWDQLRENRDHIVRANRDGLIIDPDVTSAGLIERATADPLSEEAVTDNFEHIFASAEALAAEKDSEVVKILVHVHGGLNTFADTDKKIVGQVPQQIMNECQDWYYPVFLSWPTAPLPTWAEHTFSVREGRKAHPILGLISAPFIFTSDLLGAVAAYPDTVYYQIVNEKEQWLAGDWFHNKFMSQHWKEALLKFCEDSERENWIDRDQCRLTLDEDEYGLQANLSNQDLDASDIGFERTRRAVTLVPRYTAGTLWHSTISRAAWNNMKRRAENLFYPPQDFDFRAEQGVNAGKFFDALLDRAEMAERNGGKPYEITLVGHSMGTIVLNYNFSTLRERWLKSRSLKNIVYMAAAANIDDSLNALAPILKSTGAATTGQDAAAPERVSPNFYNLTLNRFAEVNETHLWGVVPTGSLLVSIDQHHEDPEHPLKRTFGSEVNVLSSLDAISDRLRESGGDIVFKAFDSKTNHFPAVHGDFSNIPFWRESVWMLDVGSDRRPGAPLPYTIYDKRQDNGTAELNAMTITDAR